MGSAGTVRARDGGRKKVPALITRRLTAGGKTRDKKFFLRDAQAGRQASRQASRQQWRRRRRCCRRRWREWQPWPVGHRQTTSSTRSRLCGRGSIEGPQHSPLSRGARVWRDDDGEGGREREWEREGERGTRQQPPLNFTRERSALTTRRLRAPGSPLGPSETWRVCARLSRRTFANISGGSAESYQRARPPTWRSTSAEASRFMILSREGS